MCRIFGVLGQTSVSRYRADRAQQLMVHGGPDQQGQRWGASWCLGANRLAICGGDAGEQPYCLGDSIFAVFNGEIYNHRDLRRQLTARGRVVEGGCDGTLIPSLYAEFGVDFVRLLDGMFAVALIDSRSGSPKLIAACDHLAIKSIYYHLDDVGGNLYFASELEGLSALVGHAFSIRPEQIDSYLSLRSTFDSKTFYKEVLSLSPGELLQYDLSRKVSITRYRTSLEPSWSDNAGTAGDLRHVLREETSRLLDADVPVCVVTSGGLDSSILTAAACETGQEVHSFHIGYKGDWPADERRFAREVASHTGAILHEIELDPGEIPDLVASVVRHLGQPNSAPHCISAYVLFESIRRCGFKVAIAGEGADELFAGYRRFACDRGQEGWVDNYLDELAAVPKALRESLYHDDFKLWLGSTENAQMSLAKELVQASNRGLEGLLTYELLARFPNYILRRVDHLSMAHALEVRVPYCQVRVREYACRTPAAMKVNGLQQKVLLYEAARGLVPESVLTRPKQGFTLPITEMIRPGERLFDYVSDVLESESFRSRGIFDIPTVRRLLEQQSHNRHPKSAQALWSMLICEVWLRQQGRARLDMKMRVESVFADAYSDRFRTEQLPRALNRPCRDGESIELDPSVLQDGSTEGGLKCPDA